MARRTWQLAPFVMHRPNFIIVCLGVTALLLFGLCATAPASQWQDIAADLMSPACPGRTLINCTSGYAEQWRELIRQKLARGETRAQIIQYFVDMRGEEILAQPPTHGFALTAWLFPVFVIVNGAGLIIALTCRWTKKRSRPGMASPNGDVPSAMSRPSPADNYRARLQRELKEFSA